MTTHYVIFTDLDGTLLDHHDYSWDAASEALSQAKKHNIPIILNTSKTRAEVKAIHSELHLQKNPYVIENGSAIVFPSITPDLLAQIKPHPQYHFINDQHTYVLGESRTNLCQWLNQVKKTHSFKFESYKDWTAEQLMGKTGLTLAKAIESQKKEFSEPFEWFDTDKNLEKFINLAKQKNYSILKGGRFFHLQGAITKASAVHFFKQYQSILYPKAGSLNFIALGDNHNDVDMLNCVDLAICIKSPVNEFPPVDNQAVIYSEDYGPKAWNKEILQLLNNIN